MHYLSHIRGTGFGTMELLDPDGMDQKPNRIGTYELVGFTKLDYNDNEENQTEFNTIERRFCEYLQRLEIILHKRF
jgi:hypothetical protein